MATKPAEVEVNLKDKPNFRLNVDVHAAPRGPNAPLQKIDITSNPHIDSRVDKVFSDTDYKAGPAMNELYQKGFDENFLTRMLSIGTLGVKVQRKLAPTRWAITATDDTLGKEVLSHIQDYVEIDNLAFFGSHLGNYYLVLTFPGPWRYELFELYVPKDKKISGYSTDYENYKGRKDYARDTAGGYYAARLPIAEKLRSMKRKGSVLALRFITDEYTLPLGVWVVREATRKTMQVKPIEFSDKDLLITYSKKFIMKKFGLNLNTILKQSWLLKELSQPRLTQYL